MRKNELYALLSASVALLVPSPGRFAYGLVLVVLLNLLVVLGTLFRRLVQILALDELSPVLHAVMLMFVTVLFKQLLILVSPLTALVLGFSIYLPALSSFVITEVHEERGASLSAQVQGACIRTGIFSAAALLFFLFRDIFGYGTITLPSRGGLLEFVLVHSAGKSRIGTFWASLPGALVLVAVIAAALTFIRRKFLEVEAADAL